MKRHYPRDFDRSPYIDEHEDDRGPIYVSPLADVLRDFDLALARRETLAEDVSAPVACVVPEEVSGRVRELPHEVQATGVLSPTEEP